MIPAGLCQCGCGNPTAIAERNDPTKGYVKGEPKKWLSGHHLKPSGPQYVINDATDCWEWQWGRNTKGYGKLRAGSRNTLAHRVYYERVNGPVPEGLFLDHLCRNRACVNPAHLEPVTNAENAHRGLQSRIGWKEVRAIRSSKESHVEAAVRFGLTPGNVGRIRRNELWFDPDYSPDPALVARWRAANGNTKKTHCKHGHPLSGDNLKVRWNGDRMCLTCRRRLSRESYERRAA